MKLVVFTFLFACSFLMLSCKKDSQPTPVAYTNKGSGNIDYDGMDTLVVTAYNNKSFLIQGNSIPKQNAVVALAVSFPKGRPKAGYYTPAKDSIVVSLIASNTLYWEMRATDTVTVAVSGNTLNVSFKRATFDLLGYNNSNFYTGNLTSN